MITFQDLTFVPRNGGVQALQFFDNGYGVSVVRHPFSYGSQDGLWELAVLVGSPDDWDLCYETPVTADVLGWLTEEDVDIALAKVQALPQLVV